MGEERGREGREEGGEGFGFDWDDSEDLTALSVEELKVRLEDFVRKEREVSYERRVLQGRIDLIRAELVGRHGAALSPEELARVLLGDDGDEEDRSGERFGERD